MSTPELRQGTMIADRYRLKEYKGSGSFGEVWKAEDTELGLDVAIKLYISLDQNGQSEFKDEYKVEIGRASVGKECVRRCRSRWSPYH